MVTGNELLKSTLRIFIHISRYAIWTRHWSVVKSEGSLARLIARFTTARNGYHLLSNKNERTVPLLNVSRPLLHSWMAWFKWFTVMEIDYVFILFNFESCSVSPITSPTRQTWLTQEFLLSPVAPKCEPNRYVPGRATCRPKAENGDSLLQGQSWVCSISNIWLIVPTVHKCCSSIIIPPGSIL